MKIQSVHARQILDSRGNPTVEADVVLEGGFTGRASSPSGASTGTNEALELRDGDKTKFGGKGVLKAVANVNGEIAEKIIGMDADNQKEIDETLIALDGTPNKSRLGANAILAVSLAAAKAAAFSQSIPLFEHIKNISGNIKDLVLPMPMVNILNGGAHTNWQTTLIQEFMIMPVGAKTFSDAVRMCTEIFHSLGKILEEKKLATSVGDEGGYAPIFQGQNNAFEYIKEAVEHSGYTFGSEVKLAIDVAANEIPEIPNYQELLVKYPIISIEDAFPENKWEDWQQLTSKFGDTIQLVGDDLLVTNKKFLTRAIEERSCNSILIKLNQIGTLTETIDAIKMAQDANFGVIISHRSGETEDTTIAHLAVGTSAGQIKTGSMSRTDRTAKYNELLRIEEMLGDKVKFAGNIFQK